MDFIHGMTKGSLTLPIRALVDGGPISGKAFHTRSILSFAIRKLREMDRKNQPNSVLSLKSEFRVHSSGKLETAFKSDEKEIIFRSWYNSRTESFNGGKS